MSNGRSNLVLIMLAIKQSGDTHYDRAWCREELWAVYKTLPEDANGCHRTSYLMQDAAEIFMDVLQDDWKQCATHCELDLNVFPQLSAARQRQLLSAWMKGDDQYRLKLRYGKTLTAKSDSGKTRCSKLYISINIISFAIRRNYIV